MRSGMFHTTINDTEIFVTCSINGPCVKLTVSAFFESDLSDMCSQMQAMKSKPVLLSMDVYKKRCSSKHQRYWIIVQKRKGRPEYADAAIS